MKNEFKTIQENIKKDLKKHLKILMSFHSENKYSNGDYSVGDLSDIINAIKNVENQLYLTKKY
jgi:hypothetical protein